jgi:cytochrome c oxidase subunit 4
MAHPSRSTYYATFAALLGLLALTVAAAYAELGTLATTMAVGIAVAKAVLIVLYFMHVRYEVPLVRVFAVAGVLWLMILLTLLMSDYVTRSGIASAESPATPRPSQARR